jgi:hypothetical protein
MVLVSGTPEATNALAKLLEEGRLRGGPLSVRMHIADGNSERAVVDSTAKPSGDTSAVDCVLLPRGIEVSGPQSFHQNAWSISEKDSIRIRRRFMLLGETLDSIHVRDLVCILDAFGKITAGPIEISASGAQGANAAVAAVLTKSPVALRLRELPVSFSEKGAPDHFNILRVTDMDGVLDAAKARGPVRLE